MSVAHRIGGWKGQLKALKWGGSSLCTSKNYIFCWNKSRELQEKMIELDSPN
jgi:hypothetical protein